jgi:hypothetical protein
MTRSKFLRHMDADSNQKQARKHEAEMKRRTAARRKAGTMGGPATPAKQKLATYR